MANCTINVTGTSGQVMLSYTLAGVNVNLEAPIGAKLTIDDSLYSNIKYHNISGDAIATGCSITLSTAVTETFVFSIGSYLLSGIIINDNYSSVSPKQPFVLNNINNLKEEFQQLGLVLSSFQKLSQITTSIDISKYNNETIELEFTLIDGVYENKLYIKNLPSL